MDELAFIPATLLDQCEAIVRSYHERNSGQPLPDILWKMRLGGFIEAHPALSRIIRKAAHCRSARSAAKGFILVAASLLSLEILAGNYRNWGVVYPDAQRSAEILLRKAPSNRPRLVYHYIYGVTEVRVLQRLPEAISGKPPSPENASRDDEATDSYLSARGRYRLAVRQGWKE